MAKLTISARQSASAVNFSSLLVDGKPVDDWVIPTSLSATQQKESRTLLSTWSFAGGPGTDPFDGGATAGTALSWTSDGDPTASGSSSVGIRQNSFNSGDSRGFSFTCSVGTAERTIRVYCGHYAADTGADRFSLTASISDASTGDQVVKWAGTTSDTDSYFDIQVAAGSAGQTLTVTYLAEPTGSNLLRAINLRGYWVSAEGDPIAPPESQITPVGGGQGVDSAALDAHEAGDIIIAFAYRDGNTTPPTNPDSALWTDIGANGGNTNSSRLAWRRATGPGTVSGTWTNATSVGFRIYRGCKAEGSPIGDVNNGGAASTTVSYPALTLQAADGTSWVIAAAGHRSVNTSLENPPTGMVNRLTLVDATDEIAMHDTNGGVGAWSNQNVSVGGTSSGWRSWTIELLSAPEPDPGDPVIEQDVSVQLGVDVAQEYTKAGQAQSTDLVGSQQNGVGTKQSAVAAAVAIGFSATVVCGALAPDIKATETAETVGVNQQAAAIKHAEIASLDLLHAGISGATLKTGLSLGSTSLSSKAAPSAQKIGHSDLLYQLPGSTTSSSIKLVATSQAVSLGVLFQTSTDKQLEDFRSTIIVDDVGTQHLILAVKSVQTSVLLNADCARYLQSGKLIDRASVSLLGCDTSASALKISLRATHDHMVAANTSAGVKHALSGVLLALQPIPAVLKYKFVWHSLADQLQLAIQSAATGSIIQSTVPGARSGSFSNVQYNGRPKQTITQRPGTTITRRPGR